MKEYGITEIFIVDQKQGGGTSMFAVLRSSFSVKVHSQAKISLDLWLLLKIVFDSISSKVL